MEQWRNFLILSGDYWDDMWRRRQQLAWRLAKTDLAKHYIYVEGPLSVTSLVKFITCRADSYIRERWQRIFSNRSWSIQIEKNLILFTTFAPFMNIKSSFLYRASIRISEWLLLHQLKAYFDPNHLIIWVNHSRFSDKFIKAIKHNFLWYDCTEDFAAWPGVQDWAKHDIQKNDSWLTKKANVVTAVSRALYDEKRQLNPNTYWLPNAVDIDLFLKPAESFSMPFELRNVSRPVLVFVGGMSDWPHNWKLLDQVATMRPGWTILLIGRLSVSHSTRQMLYDHSNIICVGQKDYHDLPAYLAYSDVGFQFYRLLRANDTRNGQKLFLYFAAGKPVVSTNSGDAQAYSEYVSIVDSPRDFVARVEESILKNTPSITKERQEMAKLNSWDVRIKQICEIFENVSK